MKAAHIVEMECHYSALAFARRQAEKGRKPAFFGQWCW
jgi:hypothetical protein